MGKIELLNLLTAAAWLNHMLVFAHFLLALGRLCLNFKRPHSMCVQAKAKTRSRLTSNGRKRCEVRIKRHKADKRDRHGKHRYKDAANKQEGKQAKQQINK